MSDGMGSFDGIRKANERAARLEQKHAEKRKASEAKQAERAQADAAKKVAAGGEQPYKRTIKMTSTASRKRARQAEADAAAAAEAAAQDTMMLSREDGETIKWGKARLEIVDQVIKNRPGYAEVTIDEIRKETRINLHANREALERLCNDPWVDVYDDSEGTRFRYRPMHGIRDRESLEHVLQRARADGIRQNDIEKAYDGVQEDIQRMVDAGIVIKVQASDQVFKKGQGKSADTLYANPRIEARQAASEEVRDLWAACKVPEGGNLKQQLIQRGLRDEDDYGSRDAIRKKAREKALGAKQAKAPRRPGSWPCATSRAGACTRACRPPRWCPH